MKVILTKDVSGVGKSGDLADVADGYGRNYLIPRGLAEEADAGKIREWEQRQETRKNKAKKQEQQALERQRHLQGKRVSVKVSAGEGGKLFGSVTSAQIAQAVSTQLGQEVDKKDVRLGEPIRSCGTFPFSIHLHPGIDVAMTVLVEAE
ncbi:50S ribosomal protein L9 [Aminiphilus circumscriptus]|jgi:large subunit ribosomal protein L9|uniref:50S ribosomal protein L9 n=1 Tax=Aminiphilus circumscriptus TaxID=290732 RepID=UPI000492CB0D|nr:50S ribosomal protein L9 [Aminiphilus circumscriptus]